MIEVLLPYAVTFVLALALTLLLTPIVRGMNRRMGMVDKPDARRINKVPIPRGGGLALFLGVVGSYLVMWGFSSFPIVAAAAYGKLILLAAGIVILGLVDDKFSLPPKVKLLGQVVIAVLTWAWVGLGFRDIFPAMPVWLDGIVTVFWIVGAVNAFNLIDGLDGLASGLALIATVGMAGALILTGRPTATLFYFAFAGGLLGFLRYNYNPASVFLGDCGSMFIGFVLSALPLLSHEPNSYLVSVGVPLLAMGVPIFDTSLAILRRTTRHLLNRGASDGQVMTADKDHLHHRILRAVGLNQRKAAWILYLFAFLLVGIGFVGMVLRSRSGGLWLLALTIAAIVIFRDIARIELFDIGRLLNTMAHDRRVSTRRRLAHLEVPLWVVFDIVIISLVYLLVCKSLSLDVNRAMIMRAWPIRVLLVFICLVCFRVYQTIWSRAMMTNYLALAGACVLGTLLGSVIVYYHPRLNSEMLVPFTFEFAALLILALSFTRLFRSAVRDVFYMVDGSRLKVESETSRILVYGAGLRYRSFRRELVRRAATRNRLIVGIIDDDLTLRGRYIGGVQVIGPLLQAPMIVRETKADTVVIVCELSPDWLDIVLKTLKPTGVRVTLFNLNESEIAAGAKPSAGRGLLDE